MNRLLRSLKVTAADLGICIVCGGTDGDCTCPTGDGINPAPRQFDDQRITAEEEQNKWHLCPNCKSLVAAPKTAKTYRCGICDYGLKISVIRFVPQDIPDDLVTSALPRRATRKPSLSKPRI